MAAHVFAELLGIIFSLIVHLIDQTGDGIMQKVEESHL